MQVNSNKSRRSFIKKAITGAVMAGVPSALHAAHEKTLTLKDPGYDKKYSVNDQVNIAVIGMGIMGFNDLGTAVKIPGVKVVGVCDLY
ncbi:MAG TPA: hypothetical protein VK666_15480, partial [Chryseolinea sp.]|nr:hypothetical protein [Chryseolinea sp.]